MFSNPASGIISFSRAQSWLCEIDSPAPSFEREADVSSLLLKLGSTTLAVNGFAWVVSFTGVALIIADYRSWYGERLIGSRVQIEFVSALASEP